MAKNTIALSLKGDVPLAEFARAMEHFSALVRALTEDVAGVVDVEWEIQRLEAGSATAVVVSRSPMIDVVDRVVQAYEAIGRAIQDNAPIPFPDPIAKEAKAITRLLDGKIKKVEFITEGVTSAVERPFVTEDVAQRDSVYGAIIGTVETLSKRGKLRFTLYDSLFDRAVNCYLQPGQEDLMMKFWDKRVIVTGLVRRDPLSGRPLDITDIKSVSPVENKQIEPKRLAGLLPWKSGDERAEETIRRLRNG